MTEEVRQLPKPRTVREIVFYYLQKLESLREEKTYLEIQEGLARAATRAQQVYQTTVETGSDLERRRLEWNRLVNKWRSFEKHVLKRVTKIASEGHWLAIGRCRRDADHQLIPLQHWAFLELDERENAAHGDGIEYRELRCWLTKELPVGNPFRQAIDHELVSARKSYASLVASNNQPAPRDGGPGRPSNFHLLEQMHLERRRNGVAKETRSEEAEELLAQFRAKYPNIQPPQVKTVTNRLSKLKREEAENKASP